MRPSISTALGLLVAATACHPAPRGRLAAARDGLSVAIYADRGGAPDRGRAYLDDRRWLDVPAAGWLDIVDVAADLELDSVVVASASDPGGFEASQCQRLGADLGAGAWLVGHEVTMTTAGGDEIRGHVREVGGLIGVIHDDERGVAVEVRQITSVLGLEGDDLRPDPAMLGEHAYGRLDDGSAVYGPIVALRTATATVETADAQRVVVELRALAHVRVAGVSGAPTLRCRVRARRPGRHLVRASYASDGFRWTASYRAALPDGDAAIAAIAVATRFTIAAPILTTARPATVELLAGLPDGDEPPLSVWRGDVAIGGGAVVVLGEPIERDARLGWVYRGALGSADEDATSEYWHTASHGLVWQELALAPRPDDVPGPIEIVIDAAAARVVRAQLPAADRGPPTAIRLPITTSSSLVGFRRKRQLVRDGAAIADEVLYSVSNRGDRPMRVTIEEELRAYQGARLRHERPEGAGELRPDRFRRVVEIAPGGIAQGAIVIQYGVEPIVRRPR